MTLYLFTCVELGAEVILEVVINLFISSEQWRRRAQLLDLFVALRDDVVDVTDDVIVKLDEVRSSDLDVGVVQILGVLVENHQLLLWQVDNHHSLVEILHGKTELQQVDASILLKILQKRRQKICVF